MATGGIFSEPPHARNSRSPRFRSCSLKYAKITPVLQARVCGVVLEYCCDCSKEAIEMVSEKVRFQ